MARSAFSKVMWVGRTTSAVVGLAIMLALVLGVATTALGANGNPFLLGKSNVATLVSTLVKRGPGPALSLKVGAGQPPLAVNSAGKVANLNSDQLDGQDSSAFAPSAHSHDDRYFTETESDGRFVNETDHTKAAHDALDIDADTVDGKDSGQLKGATAYARVQALDITAVLDTSRTSGFTAVRRISNGNYCLTPVSGVNPANRPAVVSVDWQTTASPEGNATASYNSHGCGDGSFQVTTERQTISGGVLVDQPANDISFIIAVP